MELPDPRHPRRALPRPSLVDDFFAPHLRPRSLAGAPVPALLHPGSRLTGRPRLDARPLGPTKLAHPAFYLVQLGDGRPGLIAAADHTRVWTYPRGSCPPAPPTWWNRLLAALTPKAGFILYAPDSVLPNAEDPNQFLRKGYVYQAMDVGLLKQAMDGMGSKWEFSDTGSQLFDYLMNTIVNPFKNSQAVVGAKDALTTVYTGIFGAPKTEPVPERVVGTPKVKLVVYSGYKTRMSQVDSAYARFSERQQTSTGAGQYYAVPGPDGKTDSAYQIKYYLGEVKVGAQWLRPR